ncbi:MAG: PTS sugar transporter subunit IIA [Desulfovibrionaceae bacterium]
MLLGDYLEKEFILPELTSASKAEVLREMIDAVGEKLPGLDKDKALTVLLERESLGTTGIGDGIAIPHGKLDDLEEIVVAVGRSEQGVEFEALDHQPCRIFFLVLAPDQVAGQHLRILAHISRLLKDPDFRANFLSANTADALWSLLRST